MADPWFEKNNPTGSVAEVGMVCDSATLGRTGQGTEPPTGSGRSAELFVWSVWAVTFMVAMALLWKYAVNVPALEDWEMVPYLTGDRPVTWADVHALSHIMVWLFRRCLMACSGTAWKAQRPVDVRLHGVGPVPSGSLFRPF